MIYPDIRGRYWGLHMTMYDGPVRVRILYADDVETLLDEDFSHNHSQYLLPSNWFWLQSIQHHEGR